MKRGILVVGIAGWAIARAAFAGEAGSCPNENYPRGRISDFAREAEVRVEGDRKRLWTPFALPVLTSRSANGEVYALDVDFSWDKSARPGELHIKLRCASTRRGLKCPKMETLAIVSDAATWELARADEFVFVVPHDLLKKLPATTGVLFRTDGMLFDFEADGAEKLRRVSPCLLKSVSDPKVVAARISAQRAEQLAVELANAEAERVFKVRPFAINMWPVALKDGRWTWGRVDAAARGGYSAVVSLDLDGKNPDVKVYFSSDSNTLER